MTLRSNRWTRNIARIVAGGLVLAGGVALQAAPGAAAEQTPITDYANYPQPLPAGCPDGRAALVDVRWSNSRGQESDDLATLDVQPGETITTSWAAFAPGCTAADGTPTIAISTKVYDAKAYPFNPAVNQTLLSGGSSCGAGSSACTKVDGRYHLSVVLPTNDVTCVVQFGTIIGMPLAVVGPNGSFYSNLTRGDDRPNMLIGSKNYQVERCEVTTTTTAAPAVAEVTTTPPPAVSPNSAVATTVAAPAVLDTSVSAGALPFTGAETRRLVTSGLLMILGGAVFMVAGRERRSAC